MASIASKLHQLIENDKKKWKETMNELLMRFQILKEITKTKMVELLCFISQLLTISWLSGDKKKSLNLPDK